MGNFEFLLPEFPAIHESACKAESLALTDPRTACFYARRTLELAVSWAYKFDSGLKLPYQDNISALIHEPTFKQIAGDAVFNKAKVIVTLGNRAVHHHRPIPESDSKVAVKELFHVCYWLAHSYARQNRPQSGLTFDPATLPTSTPVPRQTLEQLQKLSAELRNKDEKLSKLLADKNSLDEQLQRLRAEFAEVRKAAIAQPDPHDYSEAETRDYFIDLLLKEAGWALDQKQDREFEVTGMPNNQGIGKVDYVLWGNDGKPLAVVEAKRTKHDARIGQQQAKLYADCLETMYGQRPVIFYSNGYEHWLWDDVNYPPRPVQGFYKKPELELLIQRRATRRSLLTAPVNTEIVGRDYQIRAIRRICEAFESDKDRKALIVMATGAGKTRTIIALCELLMKANWAKRILFLADRVALVIQAGNNFKKHLPNAAPVNLVTEKETEGRVYISTYPTMMGLTDEALDGLKRFGVGHFDLLVVDEAHRSIYQKYRALFSYYDAPLVGLTATPKDEIDHNTYSLFDLEDGVPTDAYGLDEAIRDGWLVPPKAVSVPLKFQREGIKYDDLSEDEKDQWDALEWDEDGNPPPSRVDAAAVNQWLFNKDTVDKVLEHLMTHGLKVAGGDRLGKTIIFAKNNDHAEFIADRFNLNYPHYKGQFAKVITFKTTYAQTLIEDFSVKEKMPHIAISVDMLDTGIDVPEIVNLVLFKQVWSKTKFLQMLGRGTRLCPDLFGPGQDKKEFFVFDFCQNFEYFKQNPDGTEGSAGESLGKRLFKRRLELMGILDLKFSAADYGELVGETAEVYAEPRTEAELRGFLAELLRIEVAAMNLNNFVVRPKRLWVEKFTQADAWKSLPTESVIELAENVAGLPSELESDGEEAKRFDLLILNLQLAILKAEPAFERLCQQVKAIAGLLELKSAIPAVQEHMPLIQAIQSDEWWQDVTTPMLDSVRRRLRLLARLIDKRQRVILYTDFEDDLGAPEDVTLPEFTTANDWEKFRAKVRAFLLSHQDVVAVQKLRRNEPLTADDLTKLESILTESGAAKPEDLQKATEESKNLGLFLRSLVGLDREAAKNAFSQFLTSNTLSSNQIEFLNMIIDHLADHGLMEMDVFYESPFTDVASSGPESLFRPDQVDDLIAILAKIRSTAIVTAV